MQKLLMSVLTLALFSVALVGCGLPNPAGENNLDAINANNEGTLLEKAAEAVEETVEGAEDLVEDALEGAEDAVEGAVDAAEDAVEEAADAAQAASDAIADDLADEPIIVIE